MAESNPEFDIEQAKEEMRQEYEEETGEELPKHVTDNLQLLAPRWTDPGRIGELMQEAREADTTESVSTRQAAGMMVAAAGIAGAGGLAVGLALAGSYGLAVAGIVLTALGVVVGAALP
jgi:hypothetical protein